MSIQGGLFKSIKWNDTSAVPATVRVDKNGFYIYCKGQGGNADILEISTIRDTRTGKYVRLPSTTKLRDIINFGTSEPLEDKQIQIIYGHHMNDVNELSFSVSSKKVAQMWTEELLKLAYDHKAINACPLTFLKKFHTRLGFITEGNQHLSVKELCGLITKDKAETKRVEKALELTNLKSKNNESIFIDDFSFEKFLTFYRNLVQRQELEAIFTELFPNAQQYIPGQTNSSGTSGTSSSGGLGLGGSSSISGPKVHQHHHHHHHHHHHNKEILTGISAKYVDVDAFVQFVNKYQRDPRLNEILHPYATREQAYEWIEVYEPHKEIAKMKCLSYDGFMRYLMSDENAIIPSDRTGLYMDMTRPLNQYFISSSHNTYLTGHQLRGRSSIDMYRQCLLSGCRCVELDCWNGKVDDEPIITHGYTVVTEIPFKDVLEAINESAFKTSPYPVILSFENHCSPRQQAKMVQYCKEIFPSDVLLTEPLTDFPIDQDTALPSPEQLKRKIIIKNKKKKPKKSSTQKSFTPSSSSANQTTCDTEEQDLEESDAEEEELVAPTPPMPALVGGEGSQSSEEPQMAPVSREAEPAVEMSALVVYLQPVRFKNFDECRKRGKNYEVSSFPENQATNLLKEKPIEFVLLNKKQFTRVYPKATRVDSSNYIPQVFWNAGCQMVALNFQTLDLGMQLNMGLFDYNNKCGYLLKPDLMRRPDRVLDPFTESTVDGIIAGTVSVTVLSGQFLSERRSNTFVEVEMYGLPVDTIRRKRTKIAVNNGINPQFDRDKPFVFEKIVMPELAHLRIAAYEKTGQSTRLIGYRIIPLNGLRPGYRHLPLRSESNQPMTLATLFLKIEVNDYVPDDLAALAEALANPLKHQSVLERRQRQLMVLNEMDKDE